MLCKVIVRQDSGNEIVGVFFNQIETSSKFAAGRCASPCSFCVLNNLLKDVQSKTNLSTSSVTHYHCNCDFYVLLSPIVAQGF